jgi:hypothetical protein
MSSLCSVTPSKVVNIHFLSSLIHSENMTALEGQHTGTSLVKELLLVTLGCIMYTSNIATSFRWSQLRDINVNSVCLSLTDHKVHGAKQLTENNSDKRQLNLSIYSY